jgi:pimeloyl-ACP methyl ester carboxylesterase
MLAISALAAWLAPAAARESVSFPTQDGGTIHADLYGTGDRAVVLTHGGRFDKESWTPQAEILAAAGFRVLALDFRGYGRSTGPGQEDPLGAPLHLDVLAGIRYLQANGARTVSLVGGSMGGRAAADASMETQPGEIDALVLLAASSSTNPERMTGRKLFIVADGDTTAGGTPRLVGIRDQFAKAPEPKELLVLAGAAHAQYLFETDQGYRLLADILRFLSPRAAAPDPSDRNALLALHERVIRAHLESDVEMLLADEAADYVVANRGEVTRPTLEERRNRLGPYLRRTRFIEYRDDTPPIAHVSPDGRLGWVVVQVTARGVQTAGDGTEEEIRFTGAWIELYEKMGGVWKRTGNVSNFKP